MRPVIFFDGVCGLCNGFVDFILKIDKKNRFLFSPLQSEYAAKNLPPSYVQDLNSVVVLINGEVYTKGQAVLTIFKEIGSLWKTLTIFSLCPKIMTDKMYDLMAQNRYNLFGKKELCRIPTPEERNRFLL